MSAFTPLLILAVLAAAVPAEPAQTSGLARARQAYNDGQWDAAIAAASEALRGAGPHDASRLVLARAHLERHRQQPDAADLEAAREALRTVNPGRLSPRDQADLIVGMGLWLYASEKFGAAAELFANAIDRTGPGVASRDRLLDWWAAALDRQASVSPEAGAWIYDTIVRRMDDELVRNPGSVAAGYWLPAASRQQGELQRAWQAALAGWLRASFAPDGGAALRADLDRLVLIAIIPDRAREAASSRGDQRQAADAMVTEWEQFKGRW